MAEVTELQDDTQIEDHGCEFAMRDALFDATVGYVEKHGSEGWAVYDVLAALADTTAEHVVETLLGSSHDAELFDLAIKETCQMVEKAIRAEWLDRLETEKAETGGVN